MNVLRNSDFEGPYVVHENEVKVAPDWMPFFSGGEAPEGGERCYQPEYKPIPRSLAAYRVHSGDTAQCWFVRWKVMDAGVYQTVQVPVGALITLRAHAHCWCSQSDDPRKADGELYARLGRDLPGGEGPLGSHCAVDEVGKVDGRVPGARDAGHCGRTACHRLCPCLEQVAAVTQ